jgi:hypothetical protein
VKTARFIRSNHGASATEFALLVFPFVGIVFTVIGFSVLLWANSALQYAAADAARCAAVRTATCSDAASTRTYALSRYRGPAISQDFVYQSSECGHTVTGSGTFPLNTGIVDLSFALSATACFP